MDLRGIPMEIVGSIIARPDQKLEHDNLMVLQSIVRDINEQRFLIRVFLNINKTPALVVTVYKTSKIEKYYEGKI
jgi:hypothetical protein